MRERISTDANKSDSIKMEYNTLKKSLSNVNRQRGQLSKELFYIPDGILIIVSLTLLVLFLLSGNNTIIINECSHNIEKRNSVRTEEKIMTEVPADTKVVSYPVVIQALPETGGK